MESRVKPFINHKEFTMSKLENKKSVKVFNTTMDVVSKAEQMNDANTLYLYVETINKVTYLKFGEAFKSTVWDRYNSTGNTQHDKIIKVWKSSQHDKPIHSLLKGSFEWAGNKNENPLNTNEAYIVHSVKEVKSFIKFIDDIVNNDKIGPDFFRDRHGEPVFTPRKYQLDVINKAESILSNKDRVLINLSTRAGKSFVSLKICKDLGAKNILILTPFPSAEDSFAKLGYYNLEFAGYKYIHISANTSEKEFCDKNIIFCSYQFYDNNKKVIKYINKKIKFDFVVLDECHNTSDSDRTDEIILKHLKYDKLIYMSGTPFNDLYSGYFNKDEVVTFDFIDFIKYAKINPNEISLPELNIKNVCNLSDLQNYLTQFDPDIFSKADCFDYDVIFSDCQHAESFFRWLTQDVRKQKLIIDKPRWFDLNSQKRVIAFFKDNKQVKVAADGLKATLPNWNILRISGDNADLQSSDEETINNAFEKENTIILTCGKLTTGVTIPKLDTVWYFKDSSSTELFVQILFRTMTPCKGKDSVSMYCFDTESSLKIIKEYACIRLNEHSTSVTKDEDNDTFKGVIDDILSCINFTYFDINKFKWVSENADDYFEKVHNLPYTHKVTDTFKNWHSFDGVNDLGTEMLTEKDLIVTKSQDEAIRKQCERNNRLHDILKSVDKSNKDSKSTDDYLSDKVVKQVLKILVNLDKHIFVYSNIKSYRDLESVWPDTLPQYKANFIKLLSDNKIQLNQMIEDIRYKEIHNLRELLNSMSFSNSTDMKTPDKLLEKMYSRLSNLTGTLCDPCCGIGTMFEYAVKHHGFSKDICYGIEIDPLNVEICHKLGYKNVIQGDATDQKTWNSLIELLKRNTDMTKFDHIIMNPPYNRNLHLKILNEAIKHSDDVVNLSPVRWLQDPLAEYKKNSDFKKFKDIRDHIESLEVISAKDSAGLFNAGIWTDLGIYHITATKSNFKQMYKNAWFIDKVILNVKDSIQDHMKLGDTDFSKPFIRLSGLHGHQGTKDFYDFCSPQLSVAKKESHQGCLIHFNTEEESINFFNALHTHFYKFINKCIKLDMHVPWMRAPWMKDYTHPWTDEMLYEYFELTPEEITLIENEFKDETK